MSNVVDIPFCSEFEGDMLFGKKICTSRTKKYCDRGSIFKMVGAQYAEYMVTAVIKLPLSVVAEKLYRAEGFNSPVDFVHKWEALHPRTKYVPHQKVYVHFFVRVDEPFVYERHYR